LRSGDFAVTRGAIDSLLDATVDEITTSQKAPGALAVAGLLTDPQFQVVMRALDQKKGTDLLSAPSVTTRSGLPAKVEVIREFIYPIEYDPPDIPGTVGAGAGGAGGAIPIAPAHPAAFETRNTGVMLEVDPAIGTNGYTIDLNLKPEVVEFEGFINYGNPITAGAIDALGRPTRIVVTENRIQMPVFSTRRLTTQATVLDGQTVALGGLIREDIQDVEDKVPLLGDIPVIGYLFQSKSEERFKRNLMIFVTAKIIDPSGRRINDPADRRPDIPDTEPPRGLPRGFGDLPDIPRRDIIEIPVSPKEPIYYGK